MIGKVKLNQCLSGVLWGGLLGCFCSCLAAEPLEHSIEKYQPQHYLSGKISSAGSDTLANLMTFWAAEFVSLYPQVEFDLHSEGSATAPPALLSGQSNIAPMSRLMNKEELATFEQKFGYQPTPMRVAMDAIAVFVHQQNPLTTITMQQLAQIFAEQRHCASSEPIRYWQEFNINKPWSVEPIDVIGRNSDSGSYGFFKEVVLCNAAFFLDMQTLPGSGSIVQAISYNKNAIGFSGIGYKTSGVRTLAILQNGKANLPNKNGTTNWDYPLSRFLYLYVNKAPNKPLEPLIQEFILLVLSESGQKTVEQDGYTTIAPEIIQADLLQLTTH